MRAKTGRTLALLVLMALSASPASHAEADSDPWRGPIKSLSAPSGPEGVVLPVGKPLVFELHELAASATIDIHDRRRDSVFEARWFRGEYLVGTQRFAPASMSLPDVTPMSGNRIEVTTSTPFDRIELHEIHGRAGGDPEFVREALFAAPKGISDPENVEALACQVPLGIAYNAGFYLSLVPVSVTLQLAAGVTTYVSNVGLKACKSLLRPPPDREFRVERLTECSAPVRQEHMVGVYENALGVELAFEVGPLGVGMPDDWGDLGTPEVFHHNTDVEISVLPPGTSVPPVATTLSVNNILREAFASAEIYEECDNRNGTVRVSQLDGAGPEYECPYVENRELRFPVGRTTLRWRANPRVSPLDLIAFKLPGVPSGSKLEPWKFILTKVAKEALGLAADAFALEGYRTPTFRDAFQVITVPDEVPPTITPAPFDQTRITATNIGGQVRVTIEADEPGGVSARNYERILARMYEVADQCDRDTTFFASYPTDDLRAFWPVSTESQDNSFEITWTARDPGPNREGGRNEETATMIVEVVDIRPPAILAPPDIVEITNGQVTDLGQPLVFDFVDLNPMITNDASLPLGQGLTTVTWTATDASGNASTATQLVNIKTSNQDPNALAQAGANRAQAISFESTTLRLEGNDPDGDPLRFFVESYPDNGFFVAPLYPYFVEDFRLQAAPGEASNEALRDRCLDEDGISDQNRSYQLEFPSEPSFFTVNDDGRSFVADRGSIDCEQPSNLSRPTDYFDRLDRIARFGPDGSLEVTRNVGDFDDIVVDERNGIIVTAEDSGSTRGGFVRTYDLDLNPVESYGLEMLRHRLPDGSPGDLVSFPTSLPNDIPNLKTAIVDANGVLYVMDGKGVIYALDGFPMPGQRALFVDFLTDDVDLGDARTAVPASSLVLDSRGFLYASRNNRIYKYSPSWVDENGLAWPGELIGWLGRCDTDLAPGDEAVCDTFNQRSLGYSCTDATCGVDPDISQAERDFCDYNFTNDGNFGCRPGQFRSPRGIDIDDRDTLYVADAGNQRIQRFTVDGFFAGEAESACDGSCFVLGDFGSPRDVSVNSSRFYILDPQTDLLHVSLLTPFTDQGPDFAELVYQSNNDFACTLSADCVDSFGFSVSDGVRDPDTGQPMRSAPATVEVEVARNFRPPVATPGIAAVVSEDVETPIILDGAELDPLDTLSFELVTPPENGTVIIVGDEARYLSDPNYVGPDSFAFSVFDGFEESVPELVSVTVLNINDAPSVSPLDDATVAIGFPYTLTHDFSDPDTGEAHLLVVDWGDGTVEPEGTIEMDGTVTGPILSASGSGLGRITGEHAYTTAGTRTLEVCVTDQVDASGATKVPTAASLIGCEQATITVIDGLDIELSATASSVTAVPGQILGYDFEVENAQPSAGAGRTATGVTLAIDLSPRLGASGLTVSGPGCSREGFRIDCAIGSLAPGASATVSVSADVPITVSPGVQLDTVATATVDQDDQTPENTLLLSTPVLRPADYTVGGSPESYEDAPDATPGDGICASAAGACTLRAAVEEANATAGQQTIALVNGVFTLSEGRLPQLTESLVILGAGAEDTFIDGQDNSILSSEAGATLRLEDLTITNGNVAIRPTGDLIARRVRFSNNAAPSFFGGAILTNGALDLRDVTFDGGNTNNDGAAVFSFGDSSTLVNVTVTGGIGGGLAFTTGTHELTHVTIVGNESGGGWSSVAGALSVYGDASVTLTNSIVAGNRSGTSGNGPNCGVDAGATLTSGGGNLFGDLTQCVVALQPSDRQADDPLLGPGRSRGRGLPVLDPRTASLAIDAALASACPETDASGVARPVDGNDDGIALCDIGAAELLPETIFASGFER